MINYRFSQNTEKIPTSQLVNGDLVWNQGYLFRISELQFVDIQGVLCSRWKGEVVENVPGNESIKDSGFNGAVYGQRCDDDRYTNLIVKRNLI